MKPALILTSYVLTYVDACSMTVYQHCNYGTEMADLTDVGRYVYNSDFSNDAISSWKAYSNQGEHCAFYLCNGDETMPQYKCHYESATDGETTMESCATTVGMNDVISTIIIGQESADCLVYFFEDDNYGGSQSGPMGVGSYTLAQLYARGVNNDDISSIKVVAAAGVDCHIELYEGDNFSDNSQGRAVIPIPSASVETEHAFTLSELQSYGFQNDALSSMVVTTDTGVYVQSILLY